MGIKPSWIQFKLAPVSMRAMTSILKSLITSLTFECHFWIWILLIIFKRWLSLWLPLLDLVDRLSKMTWLGSGLELDSSKEVSLLFWKSLRFLLMCNVVISSSNDLSLAFNSWMVSLIWLISFCKSCKVTSLCFSFLNLSYLPAPQKEDSTT